MKSELVLCIDIGGTHITSAVVNKETFTLCKDSFVYEYVDSQGTQDAILDQWNAALTKSLKSINETIEGLLVSIPGPFDYENGICLMDGMHKYQSLLFMNIKQFFAEKLQVPSNCIFFFNDAHAFLLGEVYHYKWFGNRIAGLTLGTGLGSAWYDGKLPYDLNYGSAKFREGIAEDYISTRGILGFLKSNTGHDFVDVKELVDAGDAQNERTLGFEFLTRALIEFIEQYIIPLKPDAIVIGGSISKAQKFFFEDLKAAIAIPIIAASMDEMNLFYGMTTTLDSTSFKTQ